MSWPEAFTAVGITVTIMGSLVAMMWLAAKYGLKSK